MAEAMHDGDYVIVQRLGGTHKRLVRLGKQAVVVEKLKFCAHKTVDGEAQRISVEEERQAIEACNGLTADDGEEEETPAKRVKVDEAVGPQRTTFSQEKYDRARRRRQTPYVLLLRPTVHLLVDSFYAKDAWRVCGLRVDGLGEMMSRGNVHCGVRVLCVEHTMGVVSAAALQRLNGGGALVHLHEHDQAQRIPAVHAMMFDKQVLSAFYPFPLSVLRTTTAGDTLAIDVGNEGAEEPMTDAQIERQQRRQGKAQRHGQVCTWLNEGRMDALLLAVRADVDIVSLLARATPFMRNGAVFVVYSCNAQAVTAAYHYLREKKRAVEMRMAENLLRLYQVETTATHPLMQQAVQGGVMLSGVFTMS